tara:strand:- start:42 stop:617 length:576 start_codon:yes stop_codon:yes gene_type:complete
MSTYITIGKISEIAVIAIITVIAVINVQNLAHEYEEMKATKKRKIVEEFSSDDEEELNNPIYEGETDDLDDEDVVRPKKRCFQRKIPIGVNTCYAPNCPRCGNNDVRQTEHGGTFSSTDIHGKRLPSYVSSQKIRCLCCGEIFGYYLGRENFKVVTQAWFDSEQRKGFFETERQKWRVSLSEETRKAGMTR